MLCNGHSKWKLRLEFPWHERNNGIINKEHLEYTSVKRQVTSANSKQITITPSFQLYRTEYDSKKSNLWTLESANATIIQNESS
jgi:hypothetical protein